MKQVKKRNGQIVEFESKKITEAMRKAFEATHTPIEVEKLEQMTKGVLAQIETNFAETTPSVEHIQDYVEMTLMKEGYLAVAKHYIVYRYEHTKIREEKQQEVLEKIEENALKIKTRSGREIPFSEDSVRKNLARFVKGYEDAIDVETIVSQLKYEIYEGMTTDELHKALTMVVRSMIERDPAYSKVAARLLLHRMYGDVFGPDYKSDNLAEEHVRVFKTNMERLVAEGNLDPRMAEFDLDKLARALNYENDQLFEYMGLEIMASRYCMEDPKTKKTLETPSMLWMRIAMGLAIAEKKEDRERVALEFYDVLSNFYYTPGGRTLFQAGALKAQLSNCFLNTVPDSLEGIFKSVSDNAQYLKWSGGTGTDWTRVRATGSFIKGTGVPSQGIVPFLKIANDVNLAINRSGKRRGAGCVYLETWHLDIEDFLELRKNTGDERRRTHDINTANWIPDLFMKRVRDGGDWTLFSPSDVPDLHDLYGAAFEKRYMEYESMAKNGALEYSKVVSAQDLWKKMIGMLFETGHPWITWKDPCNVRSPQDHAGVIHNSNLCTEITLNTN
ncbi:MAG TPA: ATP cone domain-containing protein, partial [Candidatus Paceibacterota bacterium]|nr:ATP cone domain-containing protein [Candidatus Paceibacterota bacterium]